MGKGDTEAVKKVIQQIDKVNEAKGEARRILREIRHSRMTKEEIRAEAAKDVDDLYGTPEERGRI